MFIDALVPYGNCSLARCYWFQDEMRFRVLASGSKHVRDKTWSKDSKSSDLSIQGPTSHVFGAQIDANITRFCTKLLEIARYLSDGISLLHLNCFQTDPKESRYQKHTSSQTWARGCGGDQRQNLGKETTNAHSRCEAQHNSTWGSASDHGKRS